MRRSYLDLFTPFLERLDEEFVNLVILESH